MNISGEINDEGNSKEQGEQGMEHDDTLEKEAAQKHVIEAIEENQTLERSAVNSLALLAAYNSSSDSESDSESSSSSSTSSSSSSSEPEVEEEVVVNKAKIYRDDQHEESGDSGSEGFSSDENEKMKSPSQRPASRQRGVKAKGELDLSDLPPIEDLHISVQENECLHLGQIMSIVEQMVLVESKRGNVILDLDTVLFVDRGQKILGKIFDVLGPIDQPIYCVRFNSSGQIAEKNITVGMEVFWVSKPEHSSIVVVPNLMQQKGSDASWEHDVEPPEGCLDYSDDEQERNSRRTRRQQQQQQRRPNEIPRQRQAPRGQRCPNMSYRAQPPTMQFPNQHWYQYPPPTLPTWGPVGPVYVNPFAYQTPVIPFMQPPPPPPPSTHMPVVKMEHEEPAPPGCN